MNFFRYTFNVRFVTIYAVAAITDGLIVLVCYILGSPSVYLVRLIFAWVALFFAGIAVSCVNFIRYKRKKHAAYKPLRD